MNDKTTFRRIPNGIFNANCSLQQFLCLYALISAHFFVTIVLCAKTADYHDLTMEASRAMLNFQLSSLNSLNVHNSSVDLSRIKKSEMSTTKDNLLLHDNSDLFAASDKRLRNTTDTTSRRNKRSVVHLYNIIVCATGCNPLIYKGYGCYCGFLGSGYPVDGIDRCCWMHDRCYDATGCPTFSEYFVPYYWRCYRGHYPICAVTHGKWGGSGSCAQRLCECDRAFANCLRRYPCPSSKAMCTSSPFRLVQNIFMIL